MNSPAMFPHLHCPVLIGQPMPAPTTDMIKMDIKQIHLSMSSMCHFKASSKLLQCILKSELMNSVPIPTFSQETNLPSAICTPRTDRFR